MILTDAELHSLVNAQIRTPHTLLGMHPLGDGSGVVVRAFLPNAAAVRIVPVHEPGMPAILLEPLFASNPRQAEWIRLSSSCMLIVAK